MNAREQEVMHERHLDALLDAADAAAEMEAASIDDLMNDRFAKIKEQSREEVMFWAHDCEFGGEYLIAKLLKEYADKRKSGACSLSAADFSLFGAKVSAILEAAMHFECKGEL